MVLAFIKEFRLAAKPIATGNPPTTLTTVMTDQVDVGWASPPFGFKEIERGQDPHRRQGRELKIVTRPDHPVVIVKPDTLAKRKDMMHALHGRPIARRIDYMYGDNPQVMKDYAEFVGISEALAKRVRRRVLPQGSCSTRTRSRASTHDRARSRGS